MKNLHVVKNVEENVEKSPRRPNLANVVKFDQTWRKNVEKSPRAKMIEMQPV